jgi:mRNA interferase RelE/StbE
MKLRYKVVLLRSADKQLLRVPQVLRTRLLDAIDGLAENPFHPGVIKLQGRPGYRVRVGSMRIVFGIDTDRYIVTVTDIDHRKDVYRR